VDVAAETIRVEAVEERETRREYEMKQTMGSVKGVLTEDEQIEAGTQYNQNIHETIRDERTMKGSVIAGAGGVSMTAGAGTDGTVDIVGSNVVSEGDINLSAGGDVTITAAAEQLDVTETEQDLSVMVGVVAGNAYVDAVNTVGIVDQANRQLQAANRELNRLESLRAEGKASDRAIELAKANVAVAAANVVAATAQVAKAAKKAANTASTYGFYGEGMVRTTGTERKQVATTIRHRGSTVSGETVTIASGGTSGVQGSAVKAEEALRIQAKDVVIESVADRHTHTDKTQAVNGEVRSGDDTSWSLTYSDSKTKQTRIEQVASQLTGQLVAINVDEDLTVAGGVVRGETVAVNAGGDVTVRSMVDVDTMEHTNQSATVGTGTLGGSMGYATHRSERVGTVSSITGETVVLEADSVDVVGGVIAATDATGADTGELTLRANRLTVSDVELKTESERLQLGGRTVGSGASVPAGESHATGQTTVSLGYGKYDRLDRVNGTIGNGTVEVGNADALDDVNRDVTQVRETVSETDGGSFDASLTVDHRVFSQTGRSEMGSELKELPGNYGRSVRNVAGMPHYARNMLNETQVVDKMRDPDPEKNPDPISPMTKEEAALHQYTIKAGSPENEKYVYNKHEAVYRYNPETGNHDILLKDIPGQAADMGSYNFAAKTYPDDYQGKRDPYPNWWRERAHVIVDALPSIAFGNSPYDQTTIWMRGEESIKALRNYRNKNSNE
jgi:hypothetical protein